MPISLWNHEIDIRRITMKKAWVILAMSINCQSPKGTQTNLILLRRNNQAIHLGDKFWQVIHGVAYTPLPIGWEEGYWIQFPYSTGISA